MASNLQDGFAIYPMVEESEATGRVVGVYAELLTRMPFVPSLFKSFALCPQYLVLSYEQSAGVLDGEELKQSGQVGASVRDVVQPAEQEAVRIWQQLAAAGQLEPAWSALEPQAASSRPAADDLQERALESARALPWTVVADGTALEASGIADAAPGMAAVLDAYVKTLPRLLVLASSSAAE